MNNFSTKIGLEIHVQLATKSKMFCRCDNDAENAAPNSLVCPVCLGLPGSLPVANRQAIEWTLKTGLALNCKIAEVAKFDRKHYFYPDLPKGYQISQYDEPFCLGGHLEVDGHKVRLNRIHLEEDAGKLIHRGNASLVDLNRAGTPLMEIVTEPDITSPAMAADFLRKLTKIVRDVVEVSGASMEKGHLRCDGNISVSTSQGMSQIIEIKNLNSYKFIEKALSKAEEKLAGEHPNWPEKMSKETWGYDSDKDEIFLQRRKEEAADYRYFPEPDLPPINPREFDLEALSTSIKETADEKTAKLRELGVAEASVLNLAASTERYQLFRTLVDKTGDEFADQAAKFIVQKYLMSDVDYTEETISELVKLIKSSSELAKNDIMAIIKLISMGKTFESAQAEVSGGQSQEDEIANIVEKVLAENPAEVKRYRGGDKKLRGFFIGAVIREAKGSANPQLISKKLEELL